MRVNKDCSLTFLHLSALVDHQIESHSLPVFICSALNCGKKYTRHNSLQKHIEFCHQRAVHSCTWPGCLKEYPTRSGLSWHIQSTHQDAVECSYPECGLSFAPKNLVDHQRNMHPGWAPEFPCPLAKQEKCPEVFSNTIRAAEHVNIFHRGKIQCRYHEATGCEVMFEDTKAEHAHAALKHIFHLCNVAGCVDTVMGRPISKRHWLGHMRIHARSANIPEKSLPTPTLMVLPIKTSEVYKESRLTESEGAELDNGILDGEESFDTDELSQSIYPVAAATLHLDAMEERRVLIQERNRKILTCE